MRALLVFNPNATTTDEGVRDVIASALSSQVDLEVHPTKQRGHATHLAAGAVHEGVEVVFALGGDGTANEVIQALAGTETTLGVIPGGGANVFARALGLPNDAVAATSVLLEHLRRGSTRRINLGRAAGRYFGFNAGFGFDAAVVRLVEQNTSLKRRLRQLAFIWLATREWATGEHRTTAPITLSMADQGDRGPFSITIIANTDPYTYLGARPLHVHPEASFDRGLDLVAIRKVPTRTLLAILTGVLGDGHHVRNRNVDYLRDLERFTLSAPTPQPLMVDGDYAGEHEQVTFESVPSALSVIA